MSSFLSILLLLIPTLAFPGVEGGNGGDTVPCNFVLNSQDNLNRDLTPEEDELGGIRLLDFEPSGNFNYFFQNLANSENRQNWSQFYRLNADKNKEEVNTDIYFLDFAAALKIHVLNSNSELPAFANIGETERDEFVTANKSKPKIYFQGSNFKFFPAVVKRLFGSKLANKFMLLNYVFLEGEGRGFGSSGVGGNGSVLYLKARPGEIYEQDDELISQKQIYKGCSLKHKKQLVSRHEIDAETDFSEADDESGFNLNESNFYGVRSGLKQWLLRQQKGSLDQYKALMERLRRQEKTTVFLINSEEMKLLPMHQLSWVVFHELLWSYIDYTPILRKLNFFIHSTLVLNYINPEDWDLFKLRRCSDPSAAITNLENDLREFLKPEFLSYAEIIQLENKEEYDDMDREEIANREFDSLWNKLTAKMTLGDKQNLQLRTDESADEDDGGFRDYDVFQNTGSYKKASDTPYFKDDCRR